MAILKFLSNHDSKQNKFIIAALVAAIAAARQLGYPEVADYITTIGGAVGIYLVGNPKDVVVVSPENPSASA